MGLDLLQLDKNHNNINICNNCCIEEKYSNNSLKTCIELFGINNCGNPQYGLIGVKFNNSFISYCSVGYAGLNVYTDEPLSNNGNNLIISNFILFLIFVVIYKLV